MIELKMAFLIAEFYYYEFFSHYLIKIYCMIL